MAFKGPLLILKSSGLLTSFLTPYFHAINTCCSIILRSVTKHSTLRRLNRYFHSRFNTLLGQATTTSPIPFHYYYYRGGLTHALPIFIFLLPLHSQQHSQHSRHSLRPSPRPVPPFHPPHPQPSAPETSLQMFLRRFRSRLVNRLDRLVFHARRGRSHRADPLEARLHPLRN